MTKKRKTPEQLKEYKTEYYKQHKDRYMQLVAEWRKANPIQSKAIADRWLVKHPHYQREYRRNRKAATEPLIFQFLNEGDGRNIEDYIEYLKDQSISEQHIRWFRKDFQNILKAQKCDE